MIATSPERIIDISNQLYQASKSIRILRTISWPQDVRDTFFAGKTQKSPHVTYPDFDPSDCFAQLDAIEKALGSDDPFEDWARDTAQILRNSAHLLDSLGTLDFYKFSRKLYGSPHDPLADGMSTSYALAMQFEKLYDYVEDIDLGLPPETCNLALAVANDMEKAVSEMFGVDAPIVVLDDDIASNAIAGRRRIRIRRTACFSDNDVEQLIHHEAFIHVATSINAYRQPKFKILRAAHPGTTKTQEGLAVFAEFITGSLDLDRLRRLSDRIMAIQMSIDGADFIELYRFFLEKTDNPEQAFENARRVVRGGLIEGGSPFTKDMVYLDGLIRVHNYLRVMVSTGNIECLKLLFCGKLNLDDVPLFRQLQKMGLIEPPVYLPPWMQDMRFLLTYLSYSSFLNSIDLSKIREHYAGMDLGV